MWLAAELCQFYEITNVQPWSALLKQMHTLGMVSVYVVELLDENGHPFIYAHVHVMDLPVQDAVFDISLHLFSFL